ncbi:diguanylate cyclase (GGDEF) domain-containing protein [Colwellia chukchiensis]|uniref:Diguanylate cyclase (GGDEF) domain-containing protein n=1 Tax=Colwellia chukchiensis TaxID=641665 RepID=A0A1H7K8F6_9GAMM|nr:diguanylate cyclase [Colwellia chukchiensis]SEK83191.1 diguanylate cyclase (GGDEF) domain-containing protein [Colwellia chukchiensis]
MGIRLKLLLLISFLFITAIGNSLFTFQLKVYEKNKLDWVSHTHEVIYHSERLLNSLKDTETGQRGFLLTSDASYLQPYYAGLTDTETHIQKLKQLTIDNPEQQKRLTSISEMIDVKFAELNQTIELLQYKGDNNAAIAIVKENKGKQYMDKLRNLLTKFNNHEMLLLEKRNGDFKASRAKIDTLIIVQVIVFTFLAILTFLFLSKNLFTPLKLLLDSTHKTEAGERLDISDLIANDEMGYLMSRFFNMSEQIHKRTQILDFKAHHDQLTGLKNRTKMSNEIEIAIQDSLVTNNKLAVLFIDLNDFKILNDTLGHDVVDTILREVATRLKGAVRSDDSIFRVGGDEFVVLIKNSKTVAEVEKIVANILKMTKLPVRIQGQEIKIALSIGVAISPDDSESSHEIIKFADIAMYAAKKDKDTYFKFFDKTMAKRSSDRK